MVKILCTQLFSTSAFLQEVTPSFVSFLRFLTRSSWRLVSVEKHSLFLRINGKKRFLVKHVKLRYISFSDLCVVRRGFFSRFGENHLENFQEKILE